MKLFLSIILSFFIFFNTSAQSLDSTIKYIWKNEVTDISASVEIYGLQQINRSYCVFYLNNVDTVYNNISDSLFNKYVNTLALKCPIVKVSFYNMSDTFSANRIKMYGEEFSKFILADVQKRVPQIRTNTIIVSGIDDFAMVAMFAAINDPVKINKTALFFNREDYAFLLSSLSPVVTQRLKGKAYVYVNHQNKDDKFTDALATNLALNSSVVLYKFDFFGDEMTSNIIEEAYRWLLAEGNNYILSNDD